MTLVSIENWVFPIQTHENKVAKITQDHKGVNIKALTDNLYGIDGIYTYEPNILLTMCYADCVPVYFYSESHGYVGLAHAGWRGTYGEIVKEMVKESTLTLKIYRLSSDHQRLIHTKLMMTLK